MNSSPGNSNHLAAAALGLVAAVYLWLAFGVFPTGGYWSIDNGFKRLQADNIRFTPFLDLAIAYPGREVDPLFKYVPFGLSFHYIWNGKIHLSQPPAIAIVDKPFIALMGDRGELMAPVLTGLLSLWLVARLVESVDAGLAWLGVVLAGLATPVIFYSLNLWEHTLALALGLGAVWLVVTGEEDGRRYGLSGLLAALAAGVRKEMLILIVVLAGLLAVEALYRGERGLWRRWMLWVSVCVGCSLIWWGFSYFSSGDIIPPELRLSLRPRYTPQAYAFVHGLDTLPHFIFGPASGQIGRWLTVALVGYWLSDWIPARRERQLLQLGLLLGIGWGVWTLAQSYAKDGNVYGLLSAAPFLTLGLLPGVKLTGPLRRVLFLALSYWGIAVVGLGVFTAVGPWQGAQEWGARFMLIVFPSATVGAVAGLRQMWEQAVSSWLGKGVLVAALGLVGVSVFIQGLGLRELYQGVARRSAMQATVMAWPEPIVITNMERVAPLMPQVYASKKVFLVQSFEGLADCLGQVNTHGGGDFIFVSNGMLPETILPIIAPPGKHLIIVETRPLGDGMYGTRVAVMSQP